jgi:DNA-binding beta-propeller fold protein YncE
VGDFDDDTDLDLAVANAGSSDVSILLGKGDGSFGAAVSYGVGLGPHSVAVGDFDGDSDPDLAVANSFSNDVSILLNSCACRDGTVDPETGECESVLPQGDRCGQDAECSTDFCVDGVCCQVASCPAEESCQRFSGVCAPPGNCVGDCNGNGEVAIGELVTGINIASDILPLEACPSFDASDDGLVTIDEIMTGVNDGLYGCPTDLTDLSGTLFVTDSMANKVYTLDAASGDILASADTGEHPVGVEKANGKVYVANETAGTISVYGSATLSPRTVIPACEEPHHTAVSPDGGRFYAACLGTNKVAVVDTATDTLVGLLISGAPGARTHMPWPTKDGERLWVANWETDDITEIDLETGEILRTFPLRVSLERARPIEVVVPADNKTAYVSVPDESTIKVFDLETNQLVAEPTILTPENIILSGDGKTILASRAGLHNPTAALIFDTETLTSVAVTLPGIGDSHTDFTPHAKFGFVSLVGVPQSGIAVVDIEKAALHDFYPIPDIGFIHAVRYAPGPP